MNYLSALLIIVISALGLPYMAGAQCQVGRFDLEEGQFEVRHQIEDLFDPEIEQNGDFIDGFYFAMGFLAMRYQSSLENPVAAIFRVTIGWNRKPQIWPRNVTLNFADSTSFSLMATTMNRVTSKSGLNAREALFILEDPDQFVSIMTKPLLNLTISDHRTGNELVTSKLYPGILSEQALCIVEAS